MQWRMIFEELLHEIQKQIPKAFTKVLTNFIVKNEKPNKKHAPKLIFFNEKKLRKIKIICDIGN